jgi:hypothetical protein
MRVPKRPAALEPMTQTPASILLKPNLLVRKKVRNGKTKSPPLTTIWMKKTVQMGIVKRPKPPKSRLYLCMSSAESNNVSSIIHGDDITIKEGVGYGIRRKKHISPFVTCL